MQKETSLKQHCSQLTEKLKFSGKVLATGIVIAGMMLSQSAIAVKRSERTRQVTKEVTKPIEPRVVYQFTRQLPAGRIKKVQDGASGKLTQTLLITKVLNHVVSKQVIHEERKPAKDAIFLMGKGGFNTSRHAFYRQSVRVMSATMYIGVSSSRHATRNGRRTRLSQTCTGRIAQYGVIAVDPRVIPFGTLMYVDGYGFGIAADRGSAIKGNRIDLCYGNRRVAMNFGRKNVRVHILTTH